MSGHDFHGRHPGGFEGAGAVLFPVFGTAKDVVNQAALAALNRSMEEAGACDERCGSWWNRRVHYRCAQKRMSTAWAI